MTTEEKAKIADLRCNGYGYKKIAQAIGVSVDTVKSYCRRNGLNGVRTIETVCPCCGKTLINVPGKKAKKFCSDRCRNKWWNSHLDQVKRKAIYEFICPNCKKPFTAYGNANRKYCCHECYIEDRFGGGHND